MQVQHLYMNLLLGYGITGNAPLRRSATPP